MFNGIIFNKGTVKKIIKRPKGINIFIQSNIKLSKKDIGVSVACDGVCLTLITIKSNIMEFYLSNETLKKSKFRLIKLKDKINLELLEEVLPRVILWSPLPAIWSEVEGVVPIPTLP